MGIAEAKEAWTVAKRTGNLPPGASPPLYYHPANLRPLRAVFNPPKGQRPYFRYDANHAPTGDADNESICHELAKAIIVRRCRLEISAEGRTAVFHFARAGVEVHPRWESVKAFRVDVGAILAESEDGVSEWGRGLAVEVCVTHRVGEEKREAFIAAKLAMVEIEIPKQFSLQETDRMDGAQVRALESELEEYLTGTVPIRVICGPAHRNARPFAAAPAKELTPVLECPRATEPQARASTPPAHVPVLQGAPVVSRIAPAPESVRHPIPQPAPSVPAPAAPVSVPDTVAPPDVQTASVRSEDAARRPGLWDRVRARWKRLIG